MLFSQIQNFFMLRMNSFTNHLNISPKASILLMDIQALAF